MVDDFVRDCGGFGDVGVFLGVGCEVVVRCVDDGEGVVRWEGGEDWYVDGFRGGGGAQDADVQDWGGGHDIVEMEG